MGYYVSRQLIYNNHSIYNYILAPVYLLGCGWTLRMFVNHKLV